MLLYTIQYIIWDTVEIILWREFTLRENIYIHFWAWLDNVQHTLLDIKNHPYFQWATHIGLEHIMWAEWNGVTAVFPPCSKFMIISTLQIFNAKWYCLGILFESRFLFLLKSLTDTNTAAFSMDTARENFKANVVVL